MNKYLNDRDKKLLEVVAHKIVNEQNKIREKRDAIGIHNLARELDLKDAGLSIALSIIDNMVWKEDEDYFRGFKEE